VAAADSPESARPGPRDFNEHTGCVRDATERATGLVQVGANVVGSALGAGLFDTDAREGRDGVEAFSTLIAPLPALRRGVGETFSLPVGNLTDGLRVRVAVEERALVPHEPPALILTLDDRRPVAALRQGFDAGCVDVPAVVGLRLADPLGAVVPAEDDVLRHSREEAETALSPHVDSMT